MTLYGSIVHQECLERTIHAIFPNEHIITNVKKQANLQNPSSKWYLELDVWIPGLHLGLEFQDEYHFAAIWYYQQPLTSVQLSDDLKSKLVLKMNSTLVQVPIWWDLKKSSLMGSIHFQRPELCASHSDPIPLNPPRNAFYTFRVPDVGDVMLASFMSQDARLVDLFGTRKNWWLGEKYDGIRCIWNFVKRELFTRRGNVLLVPQAHLQWCMKVPTFVDCEIWCGRGGFAEMQKTYTNPDADWSFTRLIIFDDASPIYHQLPFENRYSNVIAHVHPGSPFLILAMRLLCKNKRVLAFFSQQIIGDYGEGVILRKPESVYEGGRSESLLKIKTARADAEALVISVAPDACTLKLPDGTIFAVDTANQKHIQLKRGDIVTYEYSNVTKMGKPVNPIISRVRTDTDWKSVVIDFLEDKHQTSSTSEGSRKYWTAAQKIDTKEVLENMVESKALDPSDPTTWYSFASTFVEQKDQLPARLFAGSFAKNLQKLFPELRLDERKFDQKYRGFWADVQNRKAFFDVFASNIGFDPLVPDNWYNVTRQQIEEHKGLGSILHYYQESFPNAIYHIYPDIGIKKERFILYHVGHWDKPENRKRFFDEFAKDNGFDPLVPEHWYKVDAHQINAQKDSEMLLRRYHNFTDAIAEAYPNIDRNKFETRPRNHWYSKANRRALLDAFAKSKGFNPLNSSDWYKIVPGDLRGIKGGIAVLDYYKRNLAKAVSHLYPTVKLDSSRFAPPHGYWAEEKHRRQFFDTFANDFTFDPLDPHNWYNISLDMLREREGFKSVLRHHGNSYKTAIRQLYPNIGIDKSKFVSSARA